MRRQEPENAELRQLLDARSLKATPVVRYVYLLQDEHERVLLVHKESHIGSVCGGFYLGWLLSCDCYWGSDTFDLDILSTARSCIGELTSLDVGMAGVRLLDAFVANNAGSQILNIVMHTRFESTVGFELCSDWDTDHVWVDIPDVAKRSIHPEDIEIANLLLPRQQR
ncbi:MAG: hypothetical protein SFV15_25785 [Polyangiaceae bacterium]|nr:hypothetical protein [Polyangiaceae bacterium]